MGQGKSVGLDASGTGVLTGADAGNYTLDTATAPTSTASITPKALTVGGTFAADDKVYDATKTAQVDASGLNVSGVIAGDTVTIASSGATGLFADKNVGQDKSVGLDASGAGVLRGTDAGNYMLETATAPTSTASITPATLTVGGSFTASDKVYDATKTAQIDAGGLNRTAQVDASGLNLGGVIAGDTVNVAGSGATGLFSDKNVGQGKNVGLDASGAGVLSGADAGNYVLDAATAPTTTASITPKALDVSGVSAQDKVYDGTTAATLNLGGASVTGVVAGDSVSIAGAFGDKNAGTNKTVGLSSAGADGGNYILANQTSTTASITPKDLTVTANDDTRPAGAAYSGGNGVTYAGFVAGEDAGVLQGLLGYGGTSQGAGAAGHYTILPEGLTSNNYAIHKVAGMLTLTAVPPEPTPPAPAPAPAPAPGPAAAPVLTLDAALSGNAGGSAIGRVGGSDGFGDVAVVQVSRPTDKEPGLLVVWVPADTASRGAGFSFALPQEFTSAMRTPDDVKITPIEGNPLQGWMHYDPQSRTIQADAVPHGALPWQQMATVNGKRMVIAVAERPHLTRRN